MLKLLIPAFICGGVIFTSAGSVLQTEKFGAFVKSNAVTSTSLTTTQDIARVSDLVSAVTECETRAVPVYFYDSYVTQHSAEIVNSALDQAETCAAAKISVTVFEATQTAQNAAKAPAIRAELSAYLDAHDLSDRAEFTIAPASVTQDTIEAPRAEIHFTLDKVTDLDKSI